MTSAEESTALAAGGTLCPACHKAELDVFFRMERVPTNSCILLQTRQEAIDCPTGDVHLGYCGACGFIYNAAFDPQLTEYSQRYEETQAFSGTFNRFHRDLADRLVAKYDLHNKTVLEIGCGKAEFLVLLAELGNNRGIGIDPGACADRLTGPSAERIELITDFYSERYACHAADLLVCKMTLEHIQAAKSFVSTVRRGLGEHSDSVAFIQVPEALRILRECAFEDIYYEHCCYFSPGSLAGLFRNSGFNVTDLAIVYGNQYLTLEAKPRAQGAPPSPVLPLEENRDELQTLVAHFSERVARKVSDWRVKLANYEIQGKQVVLWGSGSKAVSFLSTVGQYGCIEFVTDINPHRHDHYMPQTGQKIVEPHWLAQYRPDVVIAMNRNYEGEIRKDLEEMGLTPEIISL